MRDKPDELLGRFGQVRALRFQRDEQPFQAAAETDARRGFSAELLDEVVVSSAAAKCVLRTEPAGGDFPKCVAVVVEAADQGAVDGELDTRLLKQA